MTRPINRRECLQLAAAAMCVTPGMAAPKSSTITLGFSLYGMRSLTLEEGLSACAKIGYEAVELATMPDWPAEPKKLGKDDRRRLRDRLGELKLALPALMENTPLDGDDAKHKAQLERLKTVAELGNDLSTGQQPLIETILGGKPDEWEKRRELFASRLTDWAKISEAAKTIIAIKPHRMGAMNRPEHCLWLLERVKSPWIRLVYDWSHFEQRDMTMKDTVKAMLPMTRFIHVKDTVLEKGQAKFVLPGEGETDYAALLKLLRENGYSGCVCVEVSGMVSSRKDYDPMAAAKKCYAKLKPAFRKANSE
jgi:sugar phosphate isomerase/epimerase